jgi:hypothetical protein
LLGKSVVHQAMPGKKVSGCARRQITALTVNLQLAKMPNQFLQAFEMYLGQTL